MAWLLASSKQPQKTNEMTFDNCEESIESNIKILYTKTLTIWADFLLREAYGSY
jgi:hypothetical protein